MHLVPLFAGAKGGRSHLSLAGAVYVTINYLVER